MAKNFLGEFEELILLAILSLGPEKAYGVAVAEAIEMRGRKRVATGALYTALARLEGKGFIRSWTGEATAERGGRAKRYFALEAEGKKALDSSEMARQALKFGEMIPAV